MVRAISEREVRSSEPRAFPGVAIWLALAGLYMVFAGSLGATEGLAGVACASLGTIWARRAGRIGDAAFRLRRPMLRPLAGAVASLPGQTLRVGLDLMRVIVGGTATGSIQARPLSTIVRHSPFDDAAEARAERAIGVLAASLAPRSYVLRLDPARTEVVVHAFEAGRPRKDPA